MANFDSIPPLPPLQTVVDETVASEIPAKDSPLWSNQGERHALRELCFVISGECGFMLGNALYRATPGTAFLMDRWVPHPYGYAPSDDRLLHFWVHFLPDKLFGKIVMVNKGEFSYSGVSFDSGPTVRQLAEERWDLAGRESRLPAALKKQVLFSMVRTVLEEFEIRRTVPPEARVAPGETAVDHQDIVTFMRDYIAGACGRECSLDKLEKLCGFSKFHLAHMFRARTGMTIGRYINQVRWEFVELALGKGLTHKEIANQLGFSSAAAFWLWRRNERARRQSPVTE